MQRTQHIRINPIYDRMFPFRQDKRPWWVRTFWSMVIAFILVGWFYFVAAR